MNDNTSNYFSKQHHAAELYVKDHGLSIFPVQMNGKAPLTKSGHKDATNDLRQIRDWWRQWPNANIGVAVAPSGLCILDFDSKPDQGIDAAESLSSIEQTYGEIPKTPHSLTPRNGMHFFFRTQKQIPRKIGVFPGVDILGDGYGILPPSKTEVGSYTWECSHRIDETPLHSTPEWLIALATAGSGENQKAKGSDYWSDLLGRDFCEGLRNESLAIVTGHLFRRYVDPTVVLEVVQSLNKSKCKPPLNENEVINLVDSIAGRERKRRGAA